MSFIVVGLLVAAVFASKGTPQMLKPQCRANVCDDRPECPKSSCSCLFASRMDCAVYYQCVNGKPFQYKCSPGLLFNEDTLSCDYSSNVNCSFSTTMESSISTEIMNTTSSALESTTESILQNFTTSVETTTTEESTTNEMFTTEAPDTPKAVSTNYPTSETEKESSENTSESPSTEFTSFVNSSYSPTTYQTETSTETLTTKESSNFATNITTEESTSEITTTEQIPEKISTTTEDMTSNITTEESTSEITTTEQITEKISTSTEDITSNITTEESTSEITTTEQITEKISTTTEDITSKISTAKISSNTEVTDAETTNTPTERMTTPETTEEEITTITAFPSTKISTFSETTESETTTKATESSTIPETTKELITTTTNSPTQSTATEDDSQTTTSNSTPSSTSNSTPRVPDTSTDTESSIITNPTILPTTTTEAETSSQNLTTIPPPEFICPSRFGLFPDPKSCFRFYQCSHWIPYLKWCPSSLHFNPTLQVCDWPYRAGCDNANDTYNPNTTKTNVSPTVHYTTQKETSPSELLTNTPPSLFICPSRFGLFADPNSCFRFYHCSHWIPYHKWCPSELHFNARLQVCDWPYRAGCDSSGNTPSYDDTNRTCDTCDSCFIPDKDDCSAYTYCLNGTSYRLQCTENLLFNPKTEACDQSENVDCNKMKSSQPEPTTADNNDDVFNRTCACECCFLPNTKDCSKYLLCLDGYLHEGQCSSGLLYNPSIQNCDLAKRVDCEDDSPLCPEPNGDFPNPDQCASFVQCWNGIPRLEHCRNGTHFSAQKKQCLDPCEANCNGSYDCSTTSSPVISSSTQPTICVDSDGIYPSTKDCSLYYVCSDGFPYAVECPPGYHYSVEYEACIEPCDAKCDSSLDCGVSSTTSSSIRTSIVPSSTTISSSPNSTNCPGGQDGLFPSKDDCASFYQCYGGRSYLMKCPKGLDFSFKDQVCEHPCIANCNETIECSLTTPNTSTSTLSPYCPNAEGLYPVVGDCTAFYLCSNGKEHVIHCPPDLHFSEKDETCENPCDARCNVSIDCTSSTRQESSTTIQPISPECKEANGLYSNPDDCESFFQCSNGRSHLIQCPGGLHFSLDDAACERPCLAGCDLSITCPDEIPDTEGNCSCNACYLPDDNDCSAFYFCGNGSLTKGYCPFGTLFEKTSSSCQDENTVNCEPNGDPSMCPEPSGFFPYPGDCKKFLHCDHGVAHIKQCEGDLEYDPQNKVCTKPKGYCGDTAIDPHCLQPTGLFPDPENCNGFYQCENGVAYHKQCSQTLMFNPELGVCDWPENTDCGRDVTSNQFTESSLATGPHYNYSTHSSTQTTVTPSTSLHVSSTSAPCHEVPGVICPCACRVPTYDDCSSFLQCQEDGTACKKYCPDGLYFNKHEMVCDLPSNLECRDFFFGTMRRTKLLSHL